MANQEAHFIDLERLNPIREDIIDFYNIRKDALRSQYESMAINKDYAESISVAVRDRLEDLLGERPPESTKLYFLSKDAMSKIENIGNAYGNYDPRCDIIKMYLTDSQTRLLEENTLDVMILEGVIHEFVHSYAYREYHSYNVAATAEDIPTIATYNVQHGFVQTFPIDEHGGPKVGLFMEEAFSHAVQGELMDVLAKEYDLDYKERKDVAEARNITRYLAQLAGVEHKDLLKMMALAKQSPNEQEQKLRTLLEANGRDGLYDKLLTLEFNNKDSVGSFTRGLAELQNA